MQKALFASCLGLALSAVVACGSSGGGDDDDGSGGNGGNAGGEGGGVAGAAPGCTMPAEVPCEDDVVLAMNLKSEAAPGVISSTPEGTGFVSLIDATAGGAFVPDPHSYVYGRFTDAGLEKVALSDEDALTSMDWDIAFRRYVVRINSGHSGPSCVTAARVPGVNDYDGLMAAPAELMYRKDEYFTESCEIIADGTGLEGSPATALSSYWTYPGCVKMTGNVYVLELADARRVKLTVTHYYNEVSQQQCADTGQVPMESGAANFRVRWGFL
jgi:hypothetical protein